MKALKQSSGQSGGGPIVTAFAVWFAHFLVIWAVGEIWPYQWTANALAWGATTVALLTMGVHYIRLSVRHADGDLPGWSYRLARGATAMSIAAVVFCALPSVIFLP